MWFWVGYVIKRKCGLVSDFDELLLLFIFFMFVCLQLMKVYKISLDLYRDYIDIDLSDKNYIIKKEEEESNCIKYIE